VGCWRTENQQGRKIILNLVGTTRCFAPRPEPRRCIAGHLSSEPSHIEFSHADSGLRTGLKASAEPSTFYKANLNSGKCCRS
jgi:hypothetical protein